MIKGRNTAHVGRKKASRLFCKHGHSFKGANLIVQLTGARIGRRWCRKCKNVASKRFATRHPDKIRLKIRNWRAKQAKVKRSHRFIPRVTFCSLTRWNSYGTEYEFIPGPEPDPLHALILKEEAEERMKTQAWNRFISGEC